MTRLQDHNVVKWYARVTVYAALILTLIPAYARGQKPHGEVTPFILETEVYGFENDPHGRIGIKTTFARRSDGATVRVETMGPLSLGLTGRLITFMDGRSVSVVDAFRTKTTWRTIPPQARTSFHAQRSKDFPNCVRSPEETIQSVDLMDGQKVVVVTTDIPEGLLLRRETDWRAPDLGCQTLRYRVEDQKPDGSWRLRTEGKLVSLRLEEPDTKLFDDGAGYTEAKPQDIEKRLRELESSRMDNKLTEPNK